MRKVIQAVLASICALVLGADAIAAEDFPQRPIKIVVGFAAGGTTDIVARVLADRLSKVYEQAVVVENKAGANGALAADAVLHAPPDGHTLLLFAGPDVLSKIPVDRKMGLTPIATVAVGPMMVAVPSSSTYKTFGQLIWDAQMHPGTLAYGTSGLGNVQHLTGELLSQRAKVSLIHVPYKGGGAAIADLVSGQIPAAVLGSGPLLPHIVSGKVRALAVTTGKRIPQLPDVPTVAESGLPGFDASQWFALVGPKDLPAALTEKINSDVRALLKDPHLAQVLERSALLPFSSGSSDTGKFIALEAKRWEELTRSARLNLAQ